eukprot:6508262-Prorocentrum_lima.AAC.1
MTSSLVGSEMCIRDRPRVARKAVRLLCGGPRMARMATPGRVLRGRPVSYTHLTLPTICSV